MAPNRVPIISSCLRVQNQFHSFPDYKSCWSGIILCVFIQFTAHSPSISHYPPLSGVNWLDGLGVIHSRLKAEFPQDFKWNIYDLHLTCDESMLFPMIPPVLHPTPLEISAQPGISIYKTVTWIVFMIWTVWKTLPLSPLVLFWIQWIQAKHTWINIIPSFSQSPAELHLLLVVAPKLQNDISCGFSYWRIMHVM